MSGVGYSEVLVPTDVIAGLELADFGVRNGFVNRLVTFFPDIFRYEKVSHERGIRNTVSAIEKATYACWRKRPIMWSVPDSNR